MDGTGQIRVANRKKAQPDLDKILGWASNHLALHGLTGLRNRNCYRLIERKFQQRFAGHMHLLALRRNLDGRPRASANSSAYGCAFSPPTTAPITAPTAAPPPTFFAVFAVRDLPESS